jgi:polysaccharide pyruvyl transferase WcaK-like protein
VGNQVVIFDTSACSENLGDFIIMASVNQEMSPLLGSRQAITVPTHANIGKRGRKLIKSSDFCLVGGTNLLTSFAYQYRQWKFKWPDLMHLNNAILVGVGWWKYQAKPSAFTGMVYRRILSSEYQHSVRDEYTKKMLASIGIKNVINTGCPTMWSLTPEHCSQIREERSESVVFTLTDYRQNQSDDRFLIEQLIENYKHVYFWPQGIGDIKYFETLGQFSREVDILPANVEAFNDCLVKKEADYVGTRLHAGMRALQLKSRSIIIAVDNRAKEKSKSFNIPSVDRSERNALKCKINSNFKTQIHLPLENIETFRSQF